MEDINDRLIISPLFSDGQIGEASIDIKLGNTFFVTRRGNLPHIGPVQESLNDYKFQTRHHINFHNIFYLHPNELVLAGTLEYFRLPLTVAAMVTSRSKWGRVGLVIATATAVHPGFTGVLTLELVNLGEVPLELYPGISVAQIIFSDCDGGRSYLGGFSHHIDAQTAILTRDKKEDIEFWTGQVKE